MPAPVFEKCCCCDLRTGSLIIGYFLLVVLLLDICSTTEAAMSAGGKTVMTDGDICITKFPTGFMARKECGKEFEKSFASAMVALAVIILLVDVVTLAATVALLVGIHQDQLEFVKVFLICYAARICAYFVLYVVSSIVALSHAVPIMPSLLGTQIFILLLMIRIYFLVMVRSYYYS